jgi:hypothetical protein
MASVEITNRVNDCIFAALDKSLRVRFDLLVWPSSPHHPDNIAKHAELIVMQMKDVVWGSHAHLEAQMPDNWLRKHNGIYVVYPAKVRLEGGSISVQVYKTPALNSRPENILRLCDETTIANAVPMSDALVASMVEYMEALAEQKAFEDNTRSSMKILLDSCRTLNAAVEKYPELTMYIPQQYMDRMNAKVVRTKREVKEAEAPVDFSTLTSTAVLGRMTTGKEGK